MFATPLATPRSQGRLDPQEALVCTMVLVAAADSGGISDRDIGVMASLVQTLPVFEGFADAQLRHAADAAIGLLREPNGLAHAGRLVREALEPRLRETAFALGCEVIAAGQAQGQPILEMLDFLASELRLDRLVVAAIERGAKARFQRLG